MNYSKDKAFTDYVHNNLALRYIYPKMNWVVQEINGRLGENIDINNAVDYIVIDKETTRVHTVQERFREMKYRNFDDFTVRYMRPENIHKERRLSEFFKLDADYFVYGIIDVPKNDYKSANGFIKYAVLNLNRLNNCIDNGSVVIDSKLQGYKCIKRDETMVCPVNRNDDNSSNFVPFDILILDDIAPDVIEYQDGFM